MNIYLIAYCWSQSNISKQLGSKKKQYYLYISIISAGCQLVSYGNQSVLVIKLCRSKLKF